MVYFFFFKQKTAYEMRISDWSSDVCSSDLVVPLAAEGSGRVDSVDIHDGQVVEKGQLLFTIDKVRLRNALAQAEAAVATARATLRSAEREARRYAALQGVVSDQDRDTRRAAAEEARARLSQAIADRDLSQTQIDPAEAAPPST